MIHVIVPDVPRSASEWIEAGEFSHDCTSERLLALMDQYEHPLYSFLVALVGFHDAADCTQDTFLRAYEHLFRGRVVTRAWLYTVARHLAFDQLRRRQRLHADSTLLEQIHEQPPPYCHDLVRRTLAQLSPVESEVLYLFDVDGFTTGQIAVVLGISGAAVRQRLCRARERFRRRWHSMLAEED